MIPTMYNPFSFIFGHKISIRSRAAMDLSCRRALYLLCWICPFSRLAFDVSYYSSTICMKMEHFIDNLYSTVILSSIMVNRYLLHILTLALFCDTSFGERNGNNKYIISLLRMYSPFQNPCKVLESLDGETARGLSRGVKRRRNVGDALDCLPLTSLSLPSTSSLPFTKQP